MRFQVKPAILVVFLLAVAAGAESVAAQNGRDADVAGWWSGSLYGSSVVARMEQDGQMISGLVTVTGLGGQKDVYHVAGAVFGPKLYVLHGAGHVFEGEVAGGGSIQGVLTTAGGKKLDLRAERIPAPPDADAHPLPDPIPAPDKAATASPNG
jgi:hypothetical protein